MARSRRWTLCQGCRQEPNDRPTEATEIPTPGVAMGKIALSKEAAAGNDGTRNAPTTDVDLFRFEAKAGDQWIVETKAARSGSPLDRRSKFWTLLVNLCRV